MRVHELARELELTTKEIMQKLKERGVSVKSSLAALDDKVVRTLRKELGKKPIARPSVKKKAKPAAEPKKAASVEARVGAPVAEKAPRVARAKPRKGKVADESQGAGVKEAVETAEKPVRARVPAEAARLHEPGAAASVEAEAPPPVVKQLQEEAAAEAPPVIPAPPILGRKPGVTEGSTVGELAQKLGMKPNFLIKKLIDLNIFAAITQRLPADAIQRVLKDLGREDIEVLPAFGDELAAGVPETETGAVVARPPIVTVMGHIDHGKTSLLDAIRRTNVVGEERGGITQHIGAYEVELRSGKVVFLDTPGHEAFTAMRARGAKVTDVAVLVVAADDGIMPQTIEAIDHCRAADVAIVVAINKIDKPSANPDRVKRQLADRGLIPEDMGGKTICVGVSATKKVGIETLLEMLILEADMLELKANPARSATGAIVEAKVDRGRGPVATVLVQNGTLRVGDAFVSGMASGRVRAMISDKGVSVGEAGPSSPVEVLGFSEVPRAGDAFRVVADEHQAREIVLRRHEVRRGEEAKTRVMVSLEDLHRRIEQGEIRELRIVLKGDVQGSIEALGEALEQLGTDKVKLRTLHEGVGQVNESDVMLASASNAIIIAFHVGIEPKAQVLAKNEHVEIRRYAIIFEAIRDVRAAMEGLLEPEVKEVPLGSAEVRQAFQVSKVGTVAGSMVTEGKITRGALARVMRGEAQVYEGRVASVHRFKDDVKEAEKGMECGIALANFTDVQPGDVIGTFRREETPQKLE